MIAKKRIIVSFALGALLVSQAWSQERGDLRAQFGTRSMEAAQKIQEAIEAQNAKDYEKASDAINKALKADPKCPMAHNWRAIIYACQGDMDKCLEEYQATRACCTEPNSLYVGAAVDTGLALGKLGRLDESNYWLSRAVLEDPKDQFQYKWIAFRNMAINRAEAKDFTSASVSALLAYKLNPSKVGKEFVKQYVTLTDDKEEVAKILSFEKKTLELKAPKRSEKSKMTEAQTTGDAPTELIRGLLGDKQGRFIVALPGPESGKHPLRYYYFIGIGADLKMEKVELAEESGGILCSCLVQDRLFLCTDKDLLLEVDPQTGKKIASYRTKGGYLPSSIAVLPSREMAFFTSGGKLYRMNLNDGEVVDTEAPGLLVAGHPSEQFVFTFTKEDEAEFHKSDMLLIDGRPVLVQRGRSDWNQATMFKFAVMGSKLMLAEMRSNAGANTNDIVVSPEGDFVAPVSGGGWRSSVNPKHNGYNIPVFRTNDFRQVQGVFTTEAYPLGCAFNPVTGQFAAVHEQDVKIYLISGGEEELKLNGKFSGKCAWSGNGKYLILANAKGGLTFYLNELSDDEKKVASAWCKNVKPVVPQAFSKVAASFKPIAAFSKFTVVNDRPAVAALLTRVATQKAGDSPTLWDYHPLYFKTPGWTKLMAIADATRNANDAGVRVYRLRELIKEIPDNAMLLHHLGDAQLVTGQNDAAKASFLAAIQADAGRSSLTVMALWGLATVCEKRKEPLGAIYCLSMSLSLDRADAKAAERILPLLKANGFSAEAAKLKNSSPSILEAGGPAQLPKLLDAPANTKKLDSDNLYAKVAPSVVLVQTESGSGSGVCIARGGYILTNWHVVQGEAVTVIPFSYTANKLSRLKPLAATVVYQSKQSDMAVLKVNAPPTSLVPVPAATGNPRAGEKVFAIGSPGIGGDVLEQSISDGIVSSSDRRIEGNRYIQHSAAINPGNSGGPLLNEKGQLVGINTLVAALNSVGFAIPVSTLREIFKGK